MRKGTEKERFHIEERIKKMLNDKKCPPFQQNYFETD